MFELKVYRGHSNKAPTGYINELCIPIERPSGGIAHTSTNLHIFFKNVRFANAIFHTLDGNVFWTLQSSNNEAVQNTAPHRTRDIRRLQTLTVWLLLHKSLLKTFQHSYMRLHPTVWSHVRQKEIAKTISNRWNSTVETQILVAMQSVRFDVNVQQLYIFTNGIYSSVVQRDWRLNSSDPCTLRAMIPLPDINSTRSLTQSAPITAAENVSELSDLIKLRSHP